MSTAEERVRAMVAAARRIADPTDPLGARARETLPSSTGLSPEGVALALERCLEVDPSDAEIAALCASVPGAPRAHVLLASNVFVAAHRALCLALAAAPRVAVRPSRREPDMVRLLAEAGGPFQIVSELAPAAGDHVWAYGADETLRIVEESLPAGVVLHAHGAGMGLVVVDPPAFDDRTAAAIALDVALFDQRGCTSPRIVVCKGGEDRALEVGRRLARALEEVEERLPHGRYDADELADAIVYRDTATYAGHLVPAGRSWVGVGPEGTMLLPPVGRNLFVAPCRDVEPTLLPLEPHVTRAAVAGTDALHAEVARVLPYATLCSPGEMQEPPFDGPVDRRPSARRLCGIP